MTNSSPIERVVMRRVRRTYVLRFFINGLTLSGALLVVALWGIGREVWVARVLENAPSGFADLPRFYVAAFANTQLGVQALSVLVGISAVFLAREIARSIRATSTSFLQHA